MTSSAEAPKRVGAGQGFRRWIPALAISFGIALLIVSPFFWLGNASGHDISFHASSWLDAAGQWKEGILYPRWTEWANYGFGEPRFIFYPPLSWMLGATLSLVLPGNAVPDAFIVLTQTLAGLSMFSLTRRFFSPGGSLFSSACYISNPYALLIIYMRSDFAELLACAFLPALLLAALQLSGLIENRWRTPGRAVAVFALLFAAVWLCNAPAGVMASYIMVLLFAWAAIREKSLWPLVRGVGGLALGFGLASFYLIPAAYEQRWVNIAQALASGLQPSENFLYTQINDPEHNLFNWIASSVAVLLMLLTWITAILTYRNLRNAEDAGEKKKLWPVLILLGATATFLMLRPSAILWEYLPKLRFVQFPWRWMGTLALAYAFFGAEAAVRRRTAWIWAPIAALAISGTGVFLVHKAWWDSDDIPCLQDAIADGTGFEGTDEYDPAGDDHYNLAQKTPQVQILAAEGAPGSAPKAQIRVERWNAEDREIRIDSREPLRLAVRLLNYPAWRVAVNGQSVTPEAPEGTAQVILPLPSGGQQISIRFSRTSDRSFGDLLSTISVLVLVVAFSRGAGGDKAASDSPHNRALMSG